MHADQLATQETLCCAVLNESLQTITPLFRVLSLTRNDVDVYECCGSVHGGVP